MTVGLSQILVASAVLLGIGCFGLLARRNLLITLLGAQFMVLSGAIAFVAFGRFGLGHAQETGAATMAMFAGAAALAQLAIGLAMALALYRERRSFAVDAERG